MTVDAHAKAFLLLLDGDNASPALVVQDGVVAKDVLPPYVLVYTSLSVPRAAEQPDMSNLALASTSARAKAICHSVGGSAAAARAVATRVRNALLDVRPVIATRKCSPIQWVDGQDIQRDEATGTGVFDLVDVYEFDSVPA